MQVSVVVPAYNESEKVYDVVSDLKKHFDRVIVVDDGSEDNTAQLAERAGATVLRHRVNLGVGAATGTGVKFALEHGAEVVATIDADGQHDIDDLEKVVKPVVEDEVDICVGSRFKSYKNAPFPRLVANKLMNLVTMVFSTHRPTDSQSGMRAFRADVFKQMEFTADYYSFCSEMFVEAKKLGLRVEEVPIKMIYTKYSRSKGTHLMTPLFIIKDLIFKRLLEV